MADFDQEHIGVVAVGTPSPQDHLGLRQNVRLDCRRNEFFSRHFARYLPIQSSFALVFSIFEMTATLYGPSLREIKNRIRRAADYFGRPVPNSDHNGYTPFPLQRSGCAPGIHDFSPYQLGKMIEIFPQSSKSRYSFQPTQNELSKVPLPPEVRTLSIRTGRKT